MKLFEKQLDGESREEEWIANPRRVSPNIGF